tara:strand:+ start:46662 stop:47060 length:399 start_codon:yes stop_codon:yes gene_type:complete
MQPAPQNQTAMNDSVVGGNLHTGHVIHNHYHAPAQQVITPQPVQQQPSPAVYHTTSMPQRPFIQKPPANVATAYLLWFFLGLFGGHRFYLGQAQFGVVYLLTFGLFGIGWIYDLFFIPDMVNRHNFMLQQYT